MPGADAIRTSHFPDPVPLQAFLTWCVVRYKPEQGGVDGGMGKSKKCWAGVSSRSLERVWGDIIMGFAAEETGLIGNCVSLSAQGHHASLLWRRNKQDIFPVLGVISFRSI